MASHRFVTLALLLGASIMAGSAAALDAYATATLNGANSVPLIDTPTTASFVMGNVVGDEIKWTLDVKDVQDLIMAHIHYGNATTNGPPVVNLVPLANQKAVNNSLGLLQLANPLSGDQQFAASFTPADFMTDLEGMPMTDFLSDLAAGNLYVNVHTSAHVPGLIRGQLVLGGPIPSSAKMTTTLFSGVVAAAVASVCAIFF